MPIKVLLAVATLIWLGSGVYNFFNPEYLEQSLGIISTSTTGAIELRAIYGGLQPGLGALALIGLIRPAFRRHAVVALAFMCTGIAVSRGIGAMIASELSVSTAVALAFEAGVAAAAIVLLRKGSAAGDRPSA